MPVSANIIPANKNKLFWLLVAFLILIIIGGVSAVIFKDSIRVPYFSAAVPEGMPEIEVINSSTNFSISLQKNRLYSYISDKNLHNNKTIKIETSDLIQEARNGWAIDDIYSSVTIKQIGTERTVIIQINKERLKTAGWSDEMIAREASTLILQGILLDKNLYTTTQMVDDARTEGIEIIKNNNFQNVVAVK